jgi:predicted RNA-binding protein YlqC (UPF0109 family)
MVEVRAGEVPFANTRGRACSQSRLEIARASESNTPQFVIGPSPDLKIRVDSYSFVVSFSLMREFLEFIIRQLIEFPDDMVLTEIPSGRTTIFKLQLRQSDVGRVIGRSGQTIQAIRALLASSAARHGQRAMLEIVE